MRVSSYIQQNNSFQNLLKSISNFLFAGKAHFINIFLKKSLFGLFEYFFIFQKNLSH